MKKERTVVSRLMSPVNAVLDFNIRKATKLTVGGVKGACSLVSANKRNKELLERMMSIEDMLKKATSVSRHDHDIGM